MPGLQSPNPGKWSEARAARTGIEKDKMQQGAATNGDRIMSGMDRELMKSVASQLLGAGVVKIEGQNVRVRKTSRQGLKTARFQMDGRELEAIEQNPEKPSRWGKLAAEGHPVVQFRDVLTNKYVGVVVDGEAKVYGR